MKKEKAARAIGYIDDDIILSAMTEADLQGKVTAERRNNMTKKTMWKKWIAAAAAFALILSIGIIAVGMGSASSGATVALDINPSIELEIDKNEKIKEVKAINEDAVKVIGEMELDGVKLDVGMNAIIGSMLKLGYLSTDKNSILISVDAENKDKAAALKDKISGEINALFENAAVITQDFKDNRDVVSLAEANNISYAKAALIYKAVSAGLLDANGVPYTAQALAKLNVNEIKLILDSKNFNIEGVNSSGEASGGLYIGKSEALRIAFEKSELIATNAVSYEIEMDFDDDIFALVYEVELVYLGDKTKYEYEIHAKTGEILEEEVKPYNAGEHDDDLITAPEGSITREAALDIAYADAGVTQENVRRPEIELDMERGVYVYEIEFKSEGVEYEYTLDAKTGEILKRESERD